MLPDYQAGDSEFLGPSISKNQAYSCSLVDCEKMRDPHQTQEQERAFQKPKYIFFLSQT